MSIIEFILLIIVWSFLGFVLLDCLGMLDTSIEGFSFLNPKWIYNRYKRMNYIGVFFMFIILNIASPIVTAIYWTSVLLTFGRKE